jgi:MFS family permease
MIMDLAGVMSGLDAIVRAYPDMNPQVVQSISSAPALAAVAFMIIGGWLCRYINKKIVFVTGIAVGTVFGFLPHLIDLSGSFAALFAVRMICGAGAGMIQPSYASLAADHFPGQERAKVLGLGAILSSALGILSMLVAAPLAAISWRYIFIIYYFGFIVLIGAIIFVPKSLPEKQAQRNKEKIKIGLPIIILSISGFIAQLLATVFAMNMSMFVVRTIFHGDPQAVQFAGLGGVMVTVGGVIAGAIFSKTVKKAKRYMATLFCVISAIGLAVAATSTTFPVFLVGAFICGVGANWTVVTMQYLAQRMGIRVKTAQSAIIGVILAVTQLGQAAIAVFVIGLQSALGLAPDDVKSLWLATIVIYVVCAVVSGVYVTTTKKKYADDDEEALIKQGPDLPAAK